MKKRIVAFDPSLSATGWAVGEIEGSGLMIIAAGIFRSKVRGAAPRSAVIADEASAIAARYVASSAETLVLIETPAQAVNRSRHRGGGTGLANYGMCVGAVTERMRGEGYQIETYRADGWAHGYGKDKRRRIATRVWPGYTALQDSGSDAADAIAMIVWNCNRRGIKEIRTEENDRT